MSLSLTTVGKTALISAAIGLAGGLGLGWKLFRPVNPPPESYAPEVRQKDNSLVLERKPDSDAKPQHDLPSGSKLERTGTIVVVPDEEVKQIKVDWSLVDMPDGTKRVVASAEGGYVIGGVDIPVNTDPPSRQRRFGVTALAGWDLHQGKQVYGASFSYEIGCAVFQSGFIGQTVFVGAGLKW